MTAPDATELTGTAASRERCLSCFRPRGDCYCDSIPTIDNQTPILIVQHRRERFHPFNTARMVHRALARSTLLVDHVPAIAAQLTVSPGAALLYPGPDAELLEDVPADRHPRQLIIIDGTWHQAKTLVRDIPALRKLPRYGLAPVEPSRFRIRREPNAVFLSTVEATVAALRVLEPQTPGLDELLAAFNVMVERQLLHPKSENGWRRNATRTPGGRNIPKVLLGAAERIVVAYGEVLTAGDDPGGAKRAPAYWVAERLGTNERFACAIQTIAPVPAKALGHWELSDDHWRGALPLEAARANWGNFLRRDDIVAVYSHGTAQLLSQLEGHALPCVELKSIDFNPRQRYSTLDELIAVEGFNVGPAMIPGRAGQRLANAVALVKHLRAIRDCDGD